MAISTAKSVFLSLIYVLAVLIVLFLLDLGIENLLNHAVIPLFDWFNTKKIWFKVFLLLIGGTTVIYLVFSIANILGVLLNKIVLSWFPLNAFNIVASMVLAIANAIYSIVLLWKIPEHYTFWIILELILVSIFIWSINFIVVMREEKK